jgi:hypothetical protein
VAYPHCTRVRPPSVQALVPLVHLPLLAVVIFDQHLQPNWTTINTSRFATGDYRDYTPSTHTQTQTSITGTYTAARAQGSYTSTTSSDNHSGGSGDISGLTGSHNTSSTATPTTLRRPGVTRSPLSTVRNAINAWKESRPVKRDVAATVSKGWEQKVRASVSAGLVLFGQFFPSFLRLKVLTILQGGTGSFRDYP